jgi:hypothetical protein
MSCLQRAATLVVAALTLLAPRAGAGQGRDGVSMIPILLKVIEADTILENKDLEIVRIEMDIVAGSKESFRTLTDRWTYGVVAVGDDRVAALDLAAYREQDGQWVLVEEDNDEGSLATITLRPTTTARYRFVVSVTRYRQSYTSAHYGLLVYHT